MKKPYLFINNKSYKRLTEAARVPLDSWARGSVPSRIIEEVEEEKAGWGALEEEEESQLPLAPAAPAAATAAVLW